ncbi:hypothetical protein [Glycomyces sp. NPDC021274]|uniref:hypothetical protein n=1 Tax=Glycomyces sp. NPDC021274 TaxID=3155120 RepID=UPI0033D977AF
MSQPRKGPGRTARRTAGLLAALLVAGGAAAALLGRSELALTALVVANGLVLAGLMRLDRSAVRRGELAALAAQVRETTDAAGRVEQDLDALRERAEFADQRLLALVERERLVAEERHHELMRSLGGAANSDAAPSDEPVRGVR